MKKIVFLRAVLCLYLPAVMAQHAPGFITGRVMEQENGQLQPLIGANVYWSGTEKGTVTDLSGEFSIEMIPGNSKLIISFVGYQPDTVDTDQPGNLEILLNGAIELQGVEVVQRRKTTEFSMLSPVKIETIGESELEKAACCNLSESFETNPSVDVSFTDAITGTKQIQMLGLAGSYTQITRENIPDIRGLQAIYGLEYVPGPWIESIQLNKGTGSVVNGYESIAGQINVELRKPETADRFYLNVFGNEESRAEVNLNLARKVNEKWSTGLLLHGRNQSIAMDRNNDGFVDKPTGDQYIVLNRWRYHCENGWESQFGIKATINRSEGGQTGYNSEKDEGLWGMEMKTGRLEGWLKLGRIFPSKPYQSFGLQLSGLAHNQDSKFGLKDYSGQQQSAYGNFIFQSIIGYSIHKYRTGASFQYDHYTETLDSMAFDREEIVPGVFFEYTFSPSENLDVVAGIRADYHNNYGLFVTPRIHARYALASNTVLRFSAGRGQRTASILSENSSVMASSRQIIVLTEDSKLPYGLEAEKAWNLGFNFTQKFRFDYRDGAVSFDIYHTNFIHQVVIDLDASPQTVLFYNLEDKSYSTSFQSQFDYELIRRLDIRLAYRWYNVETQYLSGLNSKPLVSKNRAFINLAYATANKWKFDYTLQWHSSKRLPNTASNPEAYRLEEFSPSFFLMNAQIGKEWWEKFEVYAGVENLLDFKQRHPIVAADDPFGPYFDSSMIWGPIFGRMIYAGLRWKLK